MAMILPLMRWDERGHFFEHSYDDLQRPLGIEMTTGGNTKMVQWMVYGDNIDLSSPEDDNFRGQALRVFDQSGVMKTDSIDFKGNLLSGTRTLATDYADTIDWTSVSQETNLANVDSQAASQLESESFTTQTEYDALNRPTLVTQPDGSQHKPTYNEAGLLEKMEVQLQHESSFTEYVENIDYDAKGQRTDIYYGNGSKTRYFYDENTFRLTRLLTTRNTGSDTLQDLNYTYNPVGNIVEIEDSSQQTHYFSNSVISPKGKYEYNALYRLLKATGREKDSLPMAGSGGYTPDFVATDAQSSDTFRTYCQQFTYDELGNIQQLSHRATCGGTEHWKRNYQYNSNKPNNYLLSTYTGGTPPGTAEYTYDNHGNMLEMPHLSALNWDFSDQLKSSEKTDETTHYVYSGGERVRKVVLDTSGATDKIKYERIYLGGYELYREYDSSENLDLERETHHVMDDQRKIALLEVKTVNNGSSIPNGSRTTIVRYQFTNHLDSACLELDGNADVISYEEYHPFGTTSYSLHTNDSEVSLKRYKYVHKERDDESGLYYYGARYYAPWLCRFVSVDLLKDDYPYLTVYNYAGNKPVTHIDVDGMQGEGDEPVTHTVQKGQTLSGIAQENDMTVEELRKLNPELPSDPTKLQVGAELTLRSEVSELAFDFTEILNSRLSRRVSTDVAEFPNYIEVVSSTITQEPGNSENLSPFVEKQLQHLLKSEGGYVDDPNDDGGKTKYGIAEKREWPIAAKYLGIDPDPQNIKKLTKAQAKRYYLHSRFDKYRIGEINSSKVANAIFDQSILTPELIFKNIKGALNELGYSFDLNSKRFSDDELKAINDADADKLVNEFVKFQNRYYKSLNNTEYEKGWLNRTERLKNFK